MVCHSLTEEVQFVVTASLNVLISKWIIEYVPIGQYLGCSKSVLADKLVALIDPVRDY